MSKPIFWDDEKSKQLRYRHGVGFEEIIVAIDQNKVIIDREHSDPKYNHQRKLIVEINHYAYVVPYVESNEHIFLKTLCPSRAATRHYLTKAIS
jgi:uncharacterized DUF497 family protein